MGWKQQCASDEERVHVPSLCVCEFARTWERLDKRLEVRADTLADNRTKNRTVAIHETMCFQCNAKVTNLKSLRRLRLDCLCLLWESTQVYGIAFADKNCPWRLAPTANVRCETS